MGRAFALIYCYIYDIGIVSTLKNLTNNRTLGLRLIRLTVKQMGGTLKYHETMVLFLGYFITKSIDVLDHIMTYSCPNAVYK